MPAGDYRLHPDLGHRDYLILSDLLAWIQAVIPVTAGPVLDFGCGDSPYWPLFAGRPYARADLAGGNGLDFTIADDESIAAPDGSYQTILSTQVLEHVDLYREYLQECHRLLAPAGKLLITTHGLFEEHGHPRDFHRWTLTGLGRDLERGGFVVERADKLTVGPRALLYLMGSQIWRTNVSRKSLLGLGVSLLRRFILARPALWNGFADRHFATWQMRPAPAADESLFIGVAFVARRP
jgi:SAM-dependent methyltransferase